MQGGWRGGGEAGKGRGSLVPPLGQKLLERRLSSSPPAHFCIPSFLPHSPSSFCAVFLPEMPSAGSTPAPHTLPYRVYIPETHSSTSPGILVNRCLPLILSPHWLHLCPFGQEKPIYSSCYLGQPPPPPPLSSPFWIEWGSSWMPRRWHTALHHSQEF